MKRLYIPNKVHIYVGAECPNCGTIWNIAKRKGKFYDIDKENRLLFCGHCEVDIKKIKIKKLKLELMEV